MAIEARTDVASLEQIYTMGQDAASDMDKGRYLIGDLACLIETHYGKGDIVKFAEAINVEVDRIEDYRTVCRFYPTAIRDKFLSDHPTIRFTQLRDAKRLKNLDKALAFLSLAADLDWKVTQTRVEVSKLLGGDTSPMIKKSFMADELLRAADGIAMMKMLGSGLADLAQFVAEHKDDPDFSLQVVASYRGKPDEEGKKVA